MEQTGSSASQPRLEARNLHRIYRFGGQAFHALRGIELCLPRGGTLALVGESGSGKSTLARVLVGLERPDRGELFWAGQQIHGPDRRIQLIFQDPLASLNPRLRIGTSLAEPLVIHRLVPRATRRDRLVELLNLVGLGPELLERYPHQLSGGQRQRVCIARALALEPEVVVADEPVSALDLSVRAQVLDLFGELQERLRLSYLLVAHDLALVEQMAQQVAVMLAGAIVECGPAALLLNRPLHPYTQALLAARPSCNPRARRERARAGAEAEPGSPGIGGPNSGCGYQVRCEHALAICSRQPRLTPAGNGQSVACHHQGPRDTLGQEIN